MVRVVRVMRVARARASGAHSGRRAEGAPSVARSSSIEDFAGDLIAFVGVALGEEAAAADRALVLAVAVAAAAANANANARRRRERGLEEAGSHGVRPTVTS